VVHEEDRVAGRGRNIAHRSEWQVGNPGKNPDMPGPSPDPNSPNMDLWSYTEADTRSTTALGYTHG
jgi:hypothetical protein